MSIDRHAPLGDLAGLYVAVMNVLEGASAPQAQAVLSMAILMTGEHMGLDGPDLIAWIEQTGDSAKAVASNRPARRSSG